MGGKPVDVTTRLFSASPNNALIGGSSITTNVSDWIITSTQKKSFTPMVAIFEVSNVDRVIIKSQKAGETTVSTTEVSIKHIHIVSYCFPGFLVIR